MRGTWVVLMLAGCTVGPDYRAPVGAVPPAFREASSATIAQPVDRWWERYGDPALVALVDRAIAANGDVAIAEARIAQARARRRSTRRSVAAA